MKTLTIPAMKRWGRVHRPVAEALLLSRAFAQCERERVDAYIRPVFDRFEFWNDLEAKHGMERKRITEPKDLYLSEDEEQAKEFYAACDKAHREHGFTGPEGHCPALTAEHNVIKAEWALMRCGHSLTGLGEEPNLYGENRKKYLDLLVSICLKER